MELNEFSSILWSERRLIELLVFKLSEEKLILAAGRSDWLVHAVREVDAVASELTKVEVERAVLAQSIGVSLGMSGVPSLAKIGASVPSPWARILKEHRSALLDVLDEVENVARAGRRIPPGLSLSLPQYVARKLPGPSAADIGGPADRATSVSPSSESECECASCADSMGTLDMIVEELRGLGAATVAGPDCSDVELLSKRNRSGDGDELARVVVGLQIDEIARARARRSPIGVIQASLVEFLR